MRLTIIVPGDPVPKGRPRFTKSGHVYTPKKTAVFETAVRMHALSAMKGRKIFTGGVKLTTNFFLPIPKSWSLSKKAMATSGRLRHTVRPDTDNLVKAVKDALNGIVYVDDAQVDVDCSTKRYGEIPRTEIIVEVEHEKKGS